MSEGKRAPAISVRRRIAAALSAVWLSRAVGIATTLLLLPLMYRRLAATELGVWLLLVQGSALLAFMDFGLTSILTRRVAFARGQDDAEHGTRLGPATASELADLLASARQLYRWISLLAFVVALFVGWEFLGHVGLDEDAVTEGRVAWAILCLGYGASLGAGIWTALVSGLGYLAAASILSTGFTIAGALAQTGVVVAGGGVVGLAVTSTVGNLAVRWGTARYLRRRHPEIFAERGCASRALVASLARPSFRYWVTELGAVLVLRTSQFFIAGFEDASRIPDYYAAYTLVYNMAVLSVALGDVANVYVSQLWRADDPSRVHGMVLRSVRIGLGLMLVGVAVLLLIGDDVITAWLGRGHFVGGTLMATFCLMLALYVQQSLLLGFSRATENEIYGPWYLAAGALNVGVTWMIAGSLGLWGIALGTLVSQLVTTNWYIPLSALRRLGITWQEYTRQVLLPAGALFLATLAAVAVARAWNPWAELTTGRLGAAVIAASLVCVGGFWTVVLDERQRWRILRKIGGWLRRAIPRAA